MIEVQDRPQILQHLEKSLNVTIYDTKWMPCSAKFVAIGAHARMTGVFQVYALEGASMKVVTEMEKNSAFKCGTFGTASDSDRKLATGNFDGHLQIWDMEKPADPIYDVQAHASIVNAMDGCGGTAKGHGPPEIATCGRDGCVRVWDPRQEAAPVALFQPSNKENPLASDGELPMSAEFFAVACRDCWSVAFGNSYNDEERCVLSGYDNGDVKMFDLRMNKVRWESNVGNGVCGVQFDRKDIEMNKVVATCLESQFHVFDARTQHSRKGFAMVTEKIASGATIWSNQHLPQNRDVSMVCAGDGTLYMYKYHYPDQRRLKDPDGLWMGVPGTVELLTNKNFSSQPIGSFDWHPDKAGLFVCSAFDQHLRVGMATRLNKV